MAQPSAAHDQQSEHRAHHGDRAEVPAQPGSFQPPAQQRIESGDSQIAQQERETGVGGEARSRELHLEIAIDAAAQIGFSLSHGKWPFVRVRRFGSHLLQTTRKATFQLRSACSAQCFRRMKVNSLRHERFPFDTAHSLLPAFISGALFMGSWQCRPGRVVTYGILPSLGQSRASRGQLLEY